MHIVTGERVGQHGRLGVGCSAAVFDATHERVLLAQRADNGCWDVPGGYMDPGESFSKACAREVREETGLQVRIARLIAVYTNPDLLLEYPDGNRWQLVVLHFEGEPVGGGLRASDETRGFSYFAKAEIADLNMNPLGRMRALDAFAEGEAARIRDRF